MGEFEVIEVEEGIVLIPGPKGDQGDKGDVGPAGPQGPQGPEGRQGPVGFTGAQGDQGKDGPQGIQGPVGPAGPKGDRGPGIPTGGTSGQVLIKGITDMQWTDFPEVEAGLQAIPVGSYDSFGDLSTQYADRLTFSDDFKLTYSQSLDGEYVGTLTLSEGAGPSLPGADGEDGKSAYELAVEAGFVGTQAAWLVSLKGAKGDRGDTGATGAKGDKGDTGAQGIQGVQGPKGDTGNTGANGQGIPVGGTTGQVLRKTSATDFATEWATASGSGTVTAFTFTNGAGITGTVTNGTSTPALALSLTNITPTSVAATGTVTGTNIVRGVGGCCMGKPTDGEVIWVGEAPYAFTATSTNSSAKALVAATASTVFTIKKGTTTVGTFTFAAGATTATKSITSGSIAKGDLVSITGPGTADATLANISFLVIV